MKNKEKYLDEILEIFCKPGHTGSVCDFKREKALKRTNCINVGCGECTKRFKQWLEEEYKEKIKLKKWEYDLINTNDQPKNRRFDSFKTYQHMYEIGYFKGIYNVGLTLNEILDNCEVVE